MENTEIRFSIVRIDKKRQVHLSVKPAEWLLERIKSDTKGRDIGGLREYIADFGGAEGYEQRCPIARVYPSVVFARGGDGSLEAVAFNPIVTLHVGGLLTQADREAVKRAAAMLPMTFAAFVGADGRSVEVLVSVAPQDGKLPTQEQGMDAFCKVAYDAAFSVYGGVLPREVEPRPVMARSCFMMTLDEAPYVGSDVRPLRVSMTPQTVVATPGNAPRQQTDIDMDLYGEYELMYQQAAEVAYDETADVADVQRPMAYITELTRRLAVMGLPEEEAFIHLRNHHKYKSGFNEPALRSIVAAVYAEEHPQRHDDTVRVSRETRRLIDFMEKRYVLRRNTVMGYTEYRPNNSWIQDWGPCTMEIINNMTIEARLANLDVTFNDVKRYVQSDRVMSSNPIEQYFAAISGAWDGTTDHIGALARMVPCNFPEWERFFRKWFLGMVAQWLRRTGDYGNSLMPLLVSAQGDGKSTFCRQLLPPQLRWGFMENIDIREKRATLQAMHNFLLINIDEFNQLSRQVQDGFLKNIIQLPKVKIKPPYGRHVIDFPRLASFIATSNEQSVLTDMSGSRRFICVRLSAPIDTSVKISYDALYDQAYRLVMDGSEHNWLTPEEQLALTEHNSAFEVLPPAIHYFNEYYEAVANEAEGQWLSPTAIFERLRKEVKGGLQVKGVTAFGRSLAHLPGLRSKRSNGSSLYLVKEK